MFKRISYEEWQAMAPIIAFVLTFSVFIFQVIRAAVIKPDKSSYMAALPLESSGEAKADAEPKADPEPEA